MDQLAKLTYLKGQWDRLNQMAYECAAYLRGRVGITQEERDYAQWLVEMMSYVETEGVKVENDLRSDMLKELIKVIMG